MKYSKDLQTGELSIYYRVSTEENPDIEYIVQLHHHKNAISVNLLTSVISSNIDPRIVGGCKGKDLT